MSITFDLVRCVVADVETYPERWCVGFRGPDRAGELVTRVVDGDREQLAQALNDLVARDRILVTYNGDHFDVPVIRAILGGRDPFAIAQAIIRDEPVLFGLNTLPPLTCNHVDLAARLRRGGTFPSLKKVAAYLGR